jgi:tRNA nucleotidyltransferase (CCA-adding enzyme)
VVDPRVLRRRQPARAAALQFAARFELSVDAETRDILRAHPARRSAAERVWGEIEKLLLQAARPSIGFALARDLGIVQPLARSCGAHRLPTGYEWHPEGDVWIHTLMVIDEARKRIDGLDRGPAER